MKHNADMVKSEDEDVKTFKLFKAPEMLRALKSLKYPIVFSLLFVIIGLSLYYIESQRKIDPPIFSDKSQSWFSCSLCIQCWLVAGHVNMKIDPDDYFLTTPANLNF